MEKEFVTDCGDVKADAGSTELVFILDKSGSMEGMEKDTIGGFNAMIEKQKGLEGKVYVSTILFSNYSEVLHDRKSLEEIKPLTEKDYQVGGGTALLDAIGGAIKHIGNIHKYARPEDVPTRTLFVITTDGMENASSEYNSKKVKDMIGKQEKLGWEFLFLASNIDAVETASSIGIMEDFAVSYEVKEDTVEMFEEVGKTIHKFRTCGAMPMKCGATIENNIKKKKNKSK